MPQYLFTPRSAAERDTGVSKVQTLFHRWRFCFKRLSPSGSATNGCAGVSGPAEKQSHKDTISWRDTTTALILPRHPVYGSRLMKPSGQITPQIQNEPWKRKIISERNFKYCEVCSFSLKTDKFSFWSFPLKHKNHWQQSLPILFHMKQPSWGLEAHRRGQ